MFDKLVVGTLNRVLQGESWAQERLRKHAGQQAVIRTGSIDLYLVINERGLFFAGSRADPVSVTIELPADTPLRLISDRKSIFQAAKLSGAADFAETLAFVFRNLRWDVEADMARYLGDIPARRIELLRQKVINEGKVGAKRVLANFTEYFTEDSAMLAPGRDIVAFGRDVDALRDDVARLEKRLTRL